MSEQLNVSRGRRCVVALGSGAAAALGALATVLLARLSQDVADQLAGTGPAALLTTVSTACCGLVCARLTLCLAMVAVAAGLRPDGPGRRRGRRAALALSPALWRPAIGLLLAAGVTASSAGCEPAARAAGTVATGSAPGRTPARMVSPPAWAAAARRAEPPTSSKSSKSVVAEQAPTGTGRALVLAPPEEQSAPGLPDPGWPAIPDPGWRAPPPPPEPLLPRADASLVTSGAQRAAAPLAHAARSADDRVVVRRGDTLWAIASRSLGAGASDAEVAAEWPRWWHANRAVIGADPDLLQPGTRLVPPR
jgi:nucleoid-associated protein YgaU